MFRNLHIARIGDGQHADQEQSRAHDLVDDPAADAQVRLGIRGEDPGRAVVPPVEVEPVVVSHVHDAGPEEGADVLRGHEMQDFCPGTLPDEGQSRRHGRIEVGSRSASGHQHGQGHAHPPAPVDAEEVAELAVGEHDLGHGSVAEGDQYEGSDQLGQELADPFLANAARKSRG